MNEYEYRSIIDKTYSPCHFIILFFFLYFFISLDDYHNRHYVLHGKRSIDFRFELNDENRIAKIE